MKLALLTIWRAFLGVLWLNVFTFFMPTIMMLAWVFSANKEAMSVYVIGWILFLIGTALNGGCFLYGVVACYHDAVYEMEHLDAKGSQT